jgi:hypothetical protein
VKTCSKCKKDFQRERFVKSPRYVDGLYPICKFCRKETRLKGLVKKVLCSHCRCRPHAKSNAWCARCQRIERGRNAEPRFRRDTSNRTLCSCCKKAPRQRYHRYCRKCQNKYNNDWFKRTKWYMNLSQEQKRKMVNRRYFSNLVSTGKEPRMPCEVCGKPAEIHHLDYEHRTKNIRWLCKEHHVEAERVKKSLLTSQPLLL